MSNPPIVDEISGSVATIRFCQLTQRNPLSSTILDLFSNILQRLQQDTRIRAIVLTGIGDVFLSGADIRELTALDKPGAIAFSQKGQALTTTIAGLKPVTIAAINGYCMGGGLDFALACDIRIASTSAVFAHPGARLGIITGWGGTQRLPRVVGRSRAIELFTTARRWSSAEALQAGLITEIADPVLEAAINIANKVTTTS